MSFENEATAVAIRCTDKIRSDVRPTFGHPGRGASGRDESAAMSRLIGEPLFYPPRSKREVLAWLVLEGRDAFHGTGCNLAHNSSNVVILIGLTR